MIGFVVELVRTATQAVFRFRYNSSSARHPHRQVFDQYTEEVETNAYRAGLSVRPMAEYRRIWDLLPDLWAKWLAIDSHVPFDSVGALIRSVDPLLRNRGRSGRRSLRDLSDVLDLQTTTNECGDYGIVIPTKEPETSATTVCPPKKGVLSVSLHKGDLINRRVPLRPQRKSGDEFHSIVPNGDSGKRPTGGDDAKCCWYGEANSHERVLGHR